MKYENFNQVKTLVTEIKSIDNVIEDLENSYSVSILSRSGYDIHRTYLNSDGDVKLATEYVCAVKKFLLNKRELLNNELSSL